MAPEFRKKPWGGGSFFPYAKREIWFFSCFPWGRGECFLADTFLQTLFYAFTGFLDFSARILIFLLEMFPESPVKDIRFLGIGSKAGLFGITLFPHVGTGRLGPPGLLLAIQKIFFGRRTKAPNFFRASSCFFFILWRMVFAVSRSSAGFVFLTAFTCPKKVIREADRDSSAICFA